MEHETGDGEEVQPRPHGRQAFVVTSEAAEAGQPDETALDHPAAGQEHKAG